MILSPELLKQGDKAKESPGDCENGIAVAAGLPLSTDGELMSSAAQLNSPASGLSAETAINFGAGRAR